MCNNRQRQRAIFHTVCRAADALWPTGLNSTVLGAGEIQIQSSWEEPLRASRLHKGSWTPPWDCSPGRSPRTASLAPGTRKSRSSSRERRAPGASGGSQLATARQALPPPPLHSLPHLPLPFFFHCLPMQHFTRNLTDLTSHGEKVLSSRKTTKPTIQIFVHQQSPSTLPDSPRPPASQEPWGERRK